MDELGLLEHNFREIETDWRNGTLSEQENYVAELIELADQITEIQSVEATQLVQDVRTLREHIEAVILPAQQTRALDLRGRDDELPGEQLKEADNPPFVAD